MFKVSIKGVLVDPDGRVVLLQNERDEWELPGGQIELGESPPQCLAREIQEELCLQVEVEHPLDTYLFEVIPGHHVFIATYKCALMGPFPPMISAEHKRVGLFSRDRLPENLPAGYRTSIATAMADTKRISGKG
jgi:ADP-ribose pyrophosphatase YjhB (NUDIX family)